MPWRWWAWALSPLVLLAIGLVTEMATGAQLPQPADFAQMSGLPSAIGVGGVLVLVLLMNGFGEETGWRGFALPLLQRRFSPLTAMLVLAVIWAGWHLPMFLVVDGFRGWPALSVDGPEIHRLAETLNDLLARLDSAQRQQRQFIADAAHELRSPVAAIRLQLETADIEGTTRAAVIQQSIRLSRLVDDLMSLARLDARPDLRQEEVDLDDVVRSEVTLLRPGTPVEIDTRQLRTVRVLGDETLLGRMVRNLLDNAARYAATRITVASTQVEGNALLVVADDGPGIPAGDRDRVFDRFTRLDGARSPDEGGVGLGLAIVSDIITAHGGTVRADDNAPGTRVEVRLPAVVDQIDPPRARAHGESRHPAVLF